ncbi:hypothetical protein BgiBS90_015485 [Biomphalaria glabrata]|nr:hypothetical protein BgiBS90_015484 [Biomphalaria glabrata]KAI8783869.1 hypothetical protein BgiBS90_015485 [Biomphalaria glabrata]
MASNTRSKTDSDRKLKIQELTETAALLELEGPSRSDYIRQKLDEWEKREFELAIEREKNESDRLKNEYELARDKEKNEHERLKNEQELARDKENVRRRWRGQQFWPPRINMIPAWNHKGGSRHRFPPIPSYRNYTPSPLTASDRTHRYPNKPDLNHRSRYSPPEHDSSRWDRN